MNCKKCGEEIKEGQHCYQVCYGYIDDTETFLPEEDVAYFHDTCIPEEIRGGTGHAST